MKFSVTGKYKIWVLITVAVMIVGFVLFGIFGFNQKADYKNTDTVSVKVDANIGNASAVLEQSSKDYLSDNGFCYDRVEVLNNGGELVYYFNYSVKEDVDATALQDAVKQALSTDNILAGLNVTVVVGDNVSFENNYVGYVAIAGGVALAVMFIYALIVEKIAAALSYLASSIVSGLLFFAIMGLTRIPASPFILIGLVLSVLFAGGYSLVLSNRFNSVMKTVAGEKENPFAVADKETMQSLIKCLFTTGAILVLSLAFIILGSSAIKVLGLQLIFVAICSVFSALAYTGLVWAGIKSNVKSKYVSAKGEDNE